MNAERRTLRLLILVQVFSLFFLMMMPTLLRLMGEFWGKALYTLLVMGAIGFAIALRYALLSLE